MELRLKAGTPPAGAAPTCTGDHGPLLT
jgi:hypothetical protein